MSNESPEYKSLVHCTSDLIDCLQHSLISISSELLEKGLVTVDVHNLIQTAHGLSERDKASRLVTCVSSCIKQSTEKFSILIKILQKDLYFVGLVEKIKAECRKSDSACDIPEQEIQCLPSSLTGNNNNSFTAKTKTPKILNILA